MPIRQESIIYLAGGCFWGIEGYFRQITGVTATEVGYANGRTPEARYETLPETGHAEVLKLSYQPTEIHLAELLTHFFRIIDPTLLNRQGNDRGTQYRTGIYYTAAEQKQVAAIALEVEAKQYREPLVVELEPLQNYTPAEDLHQNYLEKNPGGYCHIRLQTASEPLYPEFPKADPAELAIRLSPLEYRVTQQAGTEPPGSSPHNHLSRSGIYVDISNGRPLFSTDDQYDAGWLAVLYHAYHHRRADLRGRPLPRHAAHRSPLTGHRQPPRPRLRRRSGRYGRLALLHQRRRPALHSPRADGKHTV